MLLLIIEMYMLLMVPASPDSYQDACIECHSDKVEHVVKHEAIENGCDICHESTGEDHPQEGRKGFKLVEQTPDLCYYCHEEAETPAHGHQPMVKGECLACHEVHGSSNPAILRLPDKEMCLSCHPIILGMEIIHSAIDNGGCVICHQPHGAEFKGLLTDRYPEEEYANARTENFALCFMCHDADLMDAEKTEWATSFRNGDRNLHHLHINGVKGRNCKLCHNLHVSKQKFLIEESIPFGSWEMQMNFEVHEEGGSCLPGCHGKESYVRQN